MLRVLAASLLAVFPAHVRADPPRRVYALHSGVHIFFAHPDKNHAAKVLRDELQRRGVPERDLIVLDCPFPDASWKNMVPRDGVIMFLESMTPSSKVAHDGYQRMHDTFEKHGVGPRDDIIWIGHSAGGQMGMTMAQLSADIAKFPKLAKSAKPYRFHTIVAFGTPVGNAFVPRDVQVRQYFSPQDPIVRIVCDFGPWILPSWGYRGKICPCTPALGKNGLVRCWYDVTHPDWLYEPRVLDRLWQDVSGSATSVWATPQAHTAAGGALAHLLGRMLEDEYRIHFDELPAK